MSLKVLNVPPKAHLQFDAPKDVKRLISSYLGSKNAILSPLDIKEIAGQIVVSCKEKKEIYAQAQKLAQHLSLKILESAVSDEIFGADGAKEMAENLREEAIRYFALTNASQKYRLGSSVSSLMHTFFVMLESFLRGMGLTDLLKPVISAQDIEMKRQQMVLFSTLFSVLTTTLIPTLGALNGGIAIAGVFVSLMGLGASYPMWRPIPSYLPKVENWTEKYRQGAFEIKEVRRELIDQIIAGLKSTKHDHLQVMLIGKSGVGKTELIKALVRAIDRGDYPEFQKKQVFYLNTADLLSHTDWVPDSQSTLSFLSDALDGHRKEIIFVFDQIHLACQTSSKNFIADQLRTMFDREKDFFPQVIGITNESEFHELLKTHTDFVNRFRFVAVGEPKEDETIQILREALIKIAPETLVKDETLRVLAAKTRESFGKDAVMPKTALRILSRCLQKVSNEQKSSLGFEVESLRRQLDYLRLQKILDRDLKSSLILDVEKKLQEKNIQLKEENEKILSLFQMRKLLSDMKKTTYELALKISSQGKENDLKMFLIFSHFFLPILEEELYKKSVGLDVSLIIDEKLINGVIEEEKILFG